MFFAQKTPDLGPKNRLRIWGVPPPPRLRIFFSAKRGLRIWGVPPTFTDKIRKIVFEGLPYVVISKLSVNCIQNKYVCLCSAKYEFWICQVLCF